MKPVVPQGIAGFYFCLEERLPSRKSIPIDFKDYEAGMSPTNIVEGMGYDAEMLGKRSGGGISKKL